RWAVRRNRLIRFGKREKERKRIHLTSKVRRSVADAVSITQSLNTSVSEVNSSGGGSASNDSSAGRWFLGALSSDLDQDDKWKVQLKVSGKPLVFKIDTGADITAILKSAFDSLPNQPKLHPAMIALFSPGGKLQCAGQFTTAVTHCNKKYQLNIFVISGEHASNLPSREAACEMGLVARLEEVDAELFGDIGL
ncbi:unnamed protein product, partial [Porites lobata]